MKEVRMKRSIGLVIAVLSLFAAGLGIVACTVGTNAPVNDHSTIESRYADSCAELSTACSNGHGCSAYTTFCGTAQGALSAFVAIEAGCKDACTDRVCRKDCKLARVVSVAAYVAGADLDGDGIAGDGLQACPTLTTMCEQDNEACDAEEFFCYATRPLPNPCAVAEAECKALCAKKDRTCMRACRDARNECMAGGGTTPDGGTPDAGTPDSYLGLLGNGSDNTANVIPGDASSLLVVYMANNHKNVNTVLPGFAQIVRDWVVLDQAAEGTTTPPPPTPTTYSLTFGTTSGSTGTGSLAVNPLGTTCTASGGLSCQTYAANTTVTLTATPATGSTFGGWTGCTSTTTSCTVTMTKALTVTARFTLAVVTPTYTYANDIAPKMTMYCNGCHGDANAPGNYHTDTYAGLLGNGSDNTPNVIPGNANSLLVQYMLNNHKNVNTVFPGFPTVVRDWVVVDNAAQ